MTNNDLNHERIAHDPNLPARIVQSLRRDATGRGMAYLNSAADLIELLWTEPGDGVRKLMAEFEEAVAQYRDAEGNVTDYYGYDKVKGDYEEALFQMLY